MTALIEKIFSELRIAPPGDLFLVLDKQNKLTLIDFDDYNHIGALGMVYGIDSASGQRSVEDLLEERSYEYYRKSVQLGPPDFFRISNKGEFKVRLSNLRKKLGLPL